MKRYQRLQLDDAFLGLDSKEKWVVRSREVPPPDRDDLILGRAYDLPDTAHLAAVASYLSEDHARAREYAKLCVESAVHFFFGDWRMKVPAPRNMIVGDWLRTHHRWMGVYEGATMWGLVLSDWGTVNRIAQYPDARCRIDTDYTKQDLDLFLAIASSVRGEPNKDVESRWKEVAGGSSKSKRLIASCFLDLLAGNQASLQDSFQAYLKNFKKVDFLKPTLTNKVSMHGTILFHLARRNQVPVAVLPDFADHIVQVP